jgi:hypothetical protein
MFGSTPWRLGMCRPFVEFTTYSWHDGKLKTINSKESKLKLKNNRI